MSGFDVTSGVRKEVTFQFDGSGGVYPDLCVDVLFLGENDAATVPIPPKPDKQTLFFDSSNDDHLSRKDIMGNVVDIEESGDVMTLTPIEGNGDTADPLRIQGSSGARQLLFAGSTGDTWQQGRSYEMPDVNGNTFWGSQSQSGTYGGTGNTLLGTEAQLGSPGANLSTVVGVSGVGEECTVAIGANAIANIPGSVVIGADSVANTGASGSIVIGKGVTASTGGEIRLQPTADTTIGSHKMFVPGLGSSGGALPHFLRYDPMSGEIQSSAGGTGSSITGAGVVPAATVWTSMDEIGTTDPTNMRPILLQDDVATQTSVGLGQGQSVPPAGGQVLVGSDQTVAGSSGGVAIGAETTLSGICSIAIGHNAISTSNRSTAIGCQAQATNTSAVSIGNANSASGNLSTVVGNSSSASGTNSISLGSGVVSTGDRSVALGGGIPSHATDDSVLIGFNAGVNGVSDDSVGIGTSVGPSGTNSIAVGNQAITNALSAVAIGQGSGATGTEAIAVGARATAGNSGAVAIGKDASASGMGAVALGDPCVASGDRSFAAGNDAITLAPASDSIALGSTVQTDDIQSLSIGSQLRNQGNNTVLIGHSGRAFVSADECVIIGENTFSSTSRTVIIGADTRTQATRTVTIGESGSANNTAATAVGSQSLAEGVRSTALGVSSNASAQDSLAVGSSATASGNRSVAIGLNTSAVDDGGVAIGSSATSLALSSIAFGDSTMSSGVGSVAIGVSSECSNNNTIALGVGNTSAHTGSVLIGSNISSTGPNQIVLAPENNTAFGTNQMFVPGLGAGGTGANFDAVMMYDTTTGEIQFNSNLDGDTGTVGGTGTPNAITVWKSPTIIGQEQDTDPVLMFASSSDVQLVIGQGQTSYGGLFGSLIIGNSTANNDPATVLGMNNSLNGGVVVGEGNTGLNGPAFMMSRGASADGRHSVLIGTSPTVNGDDGVAIGRNTVSVTESISIGGTAGATGFQAIAVGARATAGGTGAVAIGKDSVASGLNAVAIGDPTIATGERSVALGNNVSATGSNSIAIGSRVVFGPFNLDTSAGASGSIAIGAYSRVFDQANNGIAIGSITSVTDVSGIAIGFTATASRDAIAIGDEAFAGATGAISIGKGSTHGGGSYGVAIGDGSNSTNLSVAIGRNAVNMSGSNGVAIGNETETGSFGDIAIGENAETMASGVTGTIAIGVIARSDLEGIAIGTSSGATGSNSISIGTRATAGGSGAVAIGKDAFTDSSSGIAIGTNTSATNLEAIAMGENTSAFGPNSVAIGSSSVNGFETFAGTTGAIALGFFARVAGDAEHGIAIGTASRAGTANAGDTGRQNAIAVGYQSVADRINALAVGVNAQAGGSGCVAIGAYSNANDPRSVALGIGAQGANTQALAIGAGDDFTSASGPYAGALRSIAIGNTPDTTANAVDSIVIGSTATSTTIAATRGIAIGQGARVDQVNSIAIGTSARSSAGGAIALGSGTIAGHSGAITIGNTIQSGSSGICIGSNITGTDNSIIIGQNAFTTGPNCVIIGNGATGSTGNIVVIGAGATGSQDGDIIFNNAFREGSQRLVIPDLSVTSGMIAGMTGLSYNPSTGQIGTLDLNLLVSGASANGITTATAGAGGDFATVQAALVAGNRNIKVIGSTSESLDLTAGGVPSGSLLFWIENNVTFDVTNTAVIPGTAGRDIILAGTVNSVFEFSGLSSVNDTLFDCVSLTVKGITVTNSCTPGDTNICTGSTRLLIEDCIYNLPNTSGGIVGSNAVANVDLTMRDVILVNSGTSTQETLNLSTSSRSRLYNVTFQDNGTAYSNINPLVTTRGENCIVEGLYLDLATGSSTYDFTFSGQVSKVRNISASASLQINITSTSNPSTTATDLVINNLLVNSDNNNIENCTAIGFVTLSGDNNSVSGLNVGDGTTSTPLLISGMENTVTNVIINSQATTITVTSTNNNLSDIISRNSQNISISATGNILKGFIGPIGGGGVNLTANDCILDSCNFINTTATLNVSAQDCRISNCNFDGTFNITGGSECHITGCNFDGSTQAVISLGNNHTITGSFIRGGIDISGSATRATISNCSTNTGDLTVDRSFNRITGSFFRSFSITSSNNVMSNCTFNGVTGYINSGSCVISNCKMESSSSMFVMDTSADNCTVQGCIFNGSSIMLSGSNCKIGECDFANTSGVFTVNASNNLIDNCLIRGLTGYFSNISSRTFVNNTQMNTINSFFRTDGTESSFTNFRFAGTTGFISGSQTTVNSCHFTGGSTNSNLIINNDAIRVSDCYVNVTKTLVTSVADTVQLSNCLFNSGNADSEFGISGSDCILTGCRSNCLTSYIGGDGNQISNSRFTPGVINNNVDIDVFGANHSFSNVVVGTGSGTGVLNGNGTTSSVAIGCRAPDGVSGFAVTAANTNF